MSQFATLSAEKLVFPAVFPCACGKEHRVALRRLHIGTNAIACLPDVLQTLGLRMPFILCDRSTKAAAWDSVHAVLERSGIEYVLYAFESARIEPDEHAMGSLAMAFDPRCDVVIALGSGVLNDCAKILAHITGHDAIAIATAPSMDGYASNSSSMIVRGVKTSLYTQCPITIIADTAILSTAPDRMLWAGFGDMAAKYVALCEWRISSLVTGEYYCPEVAALVRNSLHAVMDSAQGLMRREPRALEAVMEGLVLSGIAMSFAEVSRPASGLEHYFSHLWEMMALERGHAYDLHGIQVGVGTLLSLDVLDQLRSITPSRKIAEDAMLHFDSARWEQSVRRVFGKTAPSILAIEASVGKNTPAKQAAHWNAIEAHWPQIRQILDEELPDLPALYAQMRQLGMPTTPQAIGVSDADVADAYLHSRDIRDKYLTSSLLWDMGLLAFIHPRVPAE